MKNLIAICLIALSISAVATNASATTFSSSHSFITFLHFDKIAFGKTVVEVYAHVGALEKNANYRGGNFYWENVQHIKMEAKGNHFFAQAKIHGSSSYETNYCQGAIVQYWVRFADGTSMITQDTMIPTQEFLRYDRETCESAMERMKSAFSGLDDADKTFGAVLTCTTLG